MVITNRKEKLHFKFHNDIEYISIHINIISFSFLYGFLKTKYLNKIEKKNVHHRRGGGVDDGNVNWCMLGRAFLCVEPGIFVLNRALLSRTMHFAVEPGSFVSNECYNSLQDSVSQL